MIHYRMNESAIKDFHYTTRCTCDILKALSLLPLETEHLKSSKGGEVGGGGELRRLLKEEKKSYNGKLREKKI